MRNKPLFPSIPHDVCLPRDIDSLQVALHDRGHVDTVIGRVANRFGESVDASGWQQSQGSLFTAIRMEKITVALLLMAVVAVAAFNIVSTLTMSVTEKARDIAVLRVIGMPRSQLMWIFMGYGGVLGGIGIGVGAILGVGLALHVADIAIFLEHFFGARLFDPSVYYIGRLPSELQWLDVVVTLSVAAFLTLVATLYPRLSRRNPSSNGGPSRCLMQSFPARGLGKAVPGRRSTNRSPIGCRFLPFVPVSVVAYCRSVGMRKIDVAQSSRRLRGADHGGEFMSLER